MFNFADRLTRDIKIYLLIVLALAFVAVGLVVVFSLGARSKAPLQEGPPVLGSSVAVEGYSVLDLAVPDETDRVLSLKPILFREPRLKWSQDEIQTYWVEPREIGIEILTRENRKKMNEIFDTVR